MNLEALPVHAVFYPASDRAATSPESALLMVVIHGRGDSPAGFAWLPSELALRNLNYLMIQAPDEYYDGYSWYDLPPNRLPGILKSRALLEKLFMSLEAQGYRSKNIILFGFSQGCVMTLEFGGRYLQPLAAGIGISGNCYDPDILAKEASPAALAGHWLITHGRADDIISYEATAEQMNILKSLGFKLEFKTYEKTHTIDMAEELPEIRQWLLEKVPTLK